MKVIFGLICLVIFSGCTDYKPFFDFDEAIHYSNPMSENDAHMLIMKENKTKDEEIKARILSSYDYPRNIADTSFINNLSRLDFVVKEIPKSRIAELNDIFKGKYVEDPMTTACEPAYNNIIVLKKNNKVTGIAKICLSCRDYNLTGTIATTEGFGQGNDFERLRKILYP